MSTEERAVAMAHFTEPAAVETVANARHWVTAFAQEHGMTGDRCTDLALAVSEAVTNAVLHAYPADEPGDVVVDTATDGDCLSVRVTDHGRGGAGTSRGLGLGLPLIARIADRVEHGPGANGVGTVILMELEMGGVADAAPVAGARTPDRLPDDG